MNTNHIKHIDATGLTCPMPLMLLKQAMADLPGGAVVSIVVTDVHAELDFEIWCERFGHLLEKTISQDKVQTFMVSKGELGPGD
ncbi:MAG: sulfurtransferase TusA family protein [Marinicella sp.]